MRAEAFMRAERSEEHTSELQSHSDLVCRLLLEKKPKITGRLYSEWAARIAALTIFLGFNVTFFFFNDPATTEISTLSLHDALPILQSDLAATRDTETAMHQQAAAQNTKIIPEDRKSTRLNSSHTVISYAVFCL